MHPVRTLLVQAPFRDTFGYSMPPPGLLRLAGELLRRDLPIELEDLALRRARGELAAGSLMCESAARLILRRGDFDVVGLSVMGATLPAALVIAGRLKDLRPGLRVVLGGPGTTGTDGAILERFPAIDAVVRGEAEDSLPELLEAWAAGCEPRTVLGITWRSGSGELVRELDRPLRKDLGSLAPYAWELLPPLLEYKRIHGETEGLTPIDSGRGCVYDCSFCTIGRFWSRRSRTLPAERLVDEIHALRHIPGAKNAYLCHDIFGADRDAALEFCALMITRGPRPWECRARVDHLDAELVQLMARAGCYRVLLGVESAAPEVREQAGKSQPRDLNVLDVVERCGRAGIRPILSLILGLPGEGEAQLEASLALIARASLLTDAWISLHLPNPQPGCALTETHGQGARPLEGIPPDMAFGAGETQPERALIAAHPDLFSTWSLLGDDPAHLHHLAELAAHLPPLLLRFPRTWELLRRAQGVSHHECFRRWRAAGCDFADFAARSADGLVRDALAWERAVAALDGAGVAAGVLALEDPRVRAVRSRATLVALRHDLPRIAGELARGAPEFDRRPRATTLAVSATAKGVRSDRVGQDVVLVLELLSTTRSLSALEREHPGIGAALGPLQRAGLLEALSEGDAPVSRTEPTP
jgi:hypothetical protein